MPQTILHPMYQHHNVYHLLFWMWLPEFTHSSSSEQFLDYLTPQSNYCNQESVTHPKTCLEV